MEKKTINKTKSNTKKTVSAKKNQTKKQQKKSKMYIPAYKIIGVCLGVITFCVVLLLLTIVMPGSEKSTQNKKLSSVPEVSITDRFTASENKKVQEEASIIKSSAEKPKTEESKPAAKNEKNVKIESAESVSAKKDVKVTENTKKPEAKPEIKKTEPQKTESVKSNTESKNTVTASKKAETKPVTIDVKNDKPAKKSPEPAPKPVWDIPKAVNNAQLVFVFDDGGQNLSHLDKFLALPFPVTIAVLPQLAHSKDSAAKIRASGNELMLHQPMQSVNEKVNPGPGAITPQMTEDEIITTLFRNINEIGPVAGLNNHEGSGITADAEKMAVVLRTASENGIFFLDSRTNVETKVPYVAHELGYSYYERNIFLDNEKTKDNVMTELLKGLTLANKNGVVIMIGHVWSADFLPEILKEIYPELLAKGYTFSVVSKCRGLKY